jgi:hypothetical protein
MPDTTRLSDYHTFINFLRFHWFSRDSPINMNVYHELLTYPYSTSFTLPSTTPFRYLSSAAPFHLMRRAEQPKQWWREYALRLASRVRTLRWRHVTSPHLHQHFESQAQPLTTSRRFSAPDHDTPALAPLKKRYGAEWRPFLDFFNEEFRYHWSLLLRVTTAPRRLLAFRLLAAINSYS